MIDEETFVRLAAYEVCGHDVQELFASESSNDVDIEAVRRRISDLDMRLAELLFTHRTAEQRVAMMKAYETILGGVRY